ncbi:MAG TPA: hypothetical protein VFS00_03360 [Polyangiaceae bacterium]|nr:hypothetical protein [Polyangiaceae bacterium]
MRNLGAFSALLLLAAPFAAACAAPDPGPEAAAEPVAAVQSELIVQCPQQQAVCQEECGGVGLVWRGSCFSDDNSCACAQEIIRPIKEGGGSTICFYTIVYDTHGDPDLIENGCFEYY